MNFYLGLALLLMVTGVIVHIVMWKFLIKPRLQSLQPPTQDTSTHKDPKDLV